MTQILRINAACKKIGISRSTLYNELAKGQFPKPIKLTQRTVGFKEDDLTAWLAARAEGKNWRDVGA